MSVQDDKTADQDDDRQLTEKPEPGEDQKRAAAEMMTAYEDRPTLVLPGAGRMVSGTAVNDWLDEDGNPITQGPDGSGSDDQAKKDQIEKDKALNVELRKAAAEETRAKSAELEGVWGIA